MPPPPPKGTPPPAVQTAPWLEALARLTRVPEAIVGHPRLPLLLASLIGIVWSLMLSSSYGIDTSDFRVGEVAPYTVRSPSQLVVPDPNATEQAREAAAARVLPRIDVMTDMGDRVQTAIGQAIAALRRNDSDPENLKRQVESALGVPIDDDLMARWRTHGTDLAFELRLKDAIRQVYQGWIAAEPERWPLAYPRGVELVDGSTEPQRLPPERFAEVASVPEAVDRTYSRVQRRYAGISEAERQLMLDLMLTLVRPNLLPNPIASDAAAQAARNAVKPVYFQLQAGEVVVRAGERVNAEQLKRLKAIEAHAATMQRWLDQIGRLLLSVLAVVLLVPYAREGGWRVFGHPQDMLFLLAVSTVVLLLIRIGRLLAEPVVFAVPELPREAVLLVMPFAALGMTFRLFFRPKIAFAIATLFALVVALHVEPPALLLPYTLLGGATGVQWLKHSKRRSQFQLAGLRVGLVQTGVWLGYALTDDGITSQAMLTAAPLALAGGLAASILASALMPLGEWFGRYVSEARLLELAQDDQPLLKWLHLNAPGTYNHSISVGRLAENAAEHIGADALLARVGAYYHDIGKGFWPQYFVENQRGGDNPHDKLKPQLSARVIIAHVTHGAELARRNRLPQVLIDFILEHHGDSRVEYFFRRAQENNDSKSNSNDDSAYRYPGPRPRSKETALVMLADVVESATRTLEQPTPDRIRAFVNRLVDRVYSEGQLSDSPLTMRDLDTIIEAFSEVLTGMYHHRVDYPLGLKPGGKDTAGGRA